MRLFSAFVAVVTLAALISPPQASNASTHPPCDRVDRFEEWSDAKNDAADAQLDKGENRRVLPIYVDLARASAECKQQNIDGHVRAGVRAGNTDEAALRKEWIHTDSMMIFRFYSKAAEAAAGLHDRRQCRSFVQKENDAFRGTDEFKGSNIEKDMRETCG